MLKCLFVCDCRATIKEMQGKGLSDMDLSLMEEEQNQANEEVVLALLQDGFHRELIAKAMEETGSYDMRERKFKHTDNLMI